MKSKEEEYKKYLNDFKKTLDWFKDYYHVPEPSKKTKISLLTDT